MEPDIGILKTNLLKAYQTKPEVFAVEEFLEQFVNESFIHLKKIIDIGDEYGNSIINMNSFWKRMCIKRYSLVKNNILMYSKGFLHGNITSHNVIITKPWYEIYCLLFHQMLKFNLKTINYNLRDVDNELFQNTKIHEEDYNLRDTSNALFQNTKIHEGDYNLRDTSNALFQNTKIHEGDYNLRDTSNALFQNTKIHKEVFLNMKGINSFILDIFGNLFMDGETYSEFLAKNVKNVFLIITPLVVDDEQYFILFISFNDNTSSIYTTYSEDLHIDNDIEFPSRLIPLKFYVRDAKVGRFVSSYIFAYKTENNILTGKEIPVKIDIYHYNNIGDNERFLRDLILDDEDNNNNTSQNINNVSLFGNFITISELTLNFDNDLMLRKEYSLEKPVGKPDECLGMRNDKYIYFKQFKLPSLSYIEGERIVDIKIKSAYELNDKQYYKVEMFLDHVVLLTTSTNRIFLLNLNFIYSISDELVFDGTNDKINDIQNMLFNTQYILLENVIKIKFEVMDDNKLYAIYILDNEHNLYYYEKTIVTNKEKIYNTPMDEEPELYSKLKNFTADEVSDIIDKILHYKVQFILIGLQITNFECDNLDVYVEKNLL